MTKDQPKPLISVVITNYNYAKFICEAIDSVVNQTYSNIEIIVIDDGSTDNSKDIIDGYTDKNTRIRSIHKDNSGVVAARNIGIDEAKGEFLLFLDADDHLDIDYVERVVECAIKKDADIVYTDVKKFGDSDEVSNFPEYSLEILKNQNYIHVSSLVRKGSIGDIRFDEGLSGQTHEDWDFFLGLCVEYRTEAVKCSETYLNYRIHSSSRNNRMEELDSGRRYIDVYAYIIRKHIQAGRSCQFSYLSGYNLANWYVSLDEYRINLEKANNEYKQTVNNLNREICAIQNSRTQKVGGLVLAPLRYVRRLLRYVIKSAVYTKAYMSSQRADRKYNHQLERFAPRAAEIDLAVVIHLFYTENWPLFHRKLQLLPDGTFDLYVSLSESNDHFIEKIRQDYPGARIILSRNKGRDVLPFMKIAKYLYKEGYKTVLKFHSKKSTHRNDGQDWLESMLNQIIPDNPSILRHIIKATDKPNFGLLGPADVYYPLTVNLPANKRYMYEIISRVKNKDIANKTLNEDRKEYGFFGGTMFWVNLEAIKDLFEYSSASYFEPEAGQIDATFAHALERLFCIIPEIDKKDIYESTGNDVVKRPYESSNIPDWSKDHDK